MKKGRSRRSPRKNRARPLIMLCLVCLLAVGGWLLKGSLKPQSQSPETQTQSESVADDRSLESQVKTIETEPQRQPVTTEPLSTTQSDTEETEPQSQQTTASSSYLASLSGLSAGTILAESQLDFENLDAYFMWWKIERGDNLYERIAGKTYQENDQIPVEDLRYLKLPHYNFKGQIQVGEIIVNADIKDDILHIFRELFEARYQIASMYLLDNYWVGNPTDSDSASIDENNTSAFCYRSASGGKKLSNHAYGRAVDINPQQNPYVSYSTGSPRWEHENADDYIDRDTGLAHVITHQDLAYQVFTKYGFLWGGDWNNPKDYQHFEKKK